METNISSKERASFAWGKVANALKWIVLSGTATFGLSELLKVVTQLNLPAWALLISVAVINTLIFGVAQFIQGSDN